MTTPWRPISLADVAAENGKALSNISMNDTDLRRMAGPGHLGANQTISMDLLSLKNRIFAYGTFLRTQCVGVDLYYVYASGDGGEYSTLAIPNSVTCGYSPPPPPPGNPPQGTILSQHCVGFELWSIIANGSGGTSDVLAQTNSPTCGYTPPPDPTG